MSPLHPYQTSLVAVVASASMLLVSCVSAPHDDTSAATTPATTEPPTDDTQGSVPPPTTIAVAELAPGSIEIVETIRIDSYYGACGNETFDLDGVTWYPVIPVDFGGDPFDEAPYAPTPTTAEPQGLVRVPAPEEGDDVGILYVYSDGIGRFISDSGKIDLWMTTEPQTYMWAC